MTRVLGAATLFKRVLKIDLGADDDILTLGITGDATAQVEHQRKATFLGNTGTDTLNQLNLVSIGGAPVVTDGCEVVN